jgi:hypothetical protein
VRHKDLPAVQYIGQRNAAVVLPLLQDLEVVDIHDKVLRLALVKDLGDCAGSASHDGRMVVEN